MIRGPLDPEGWVVPPDATLMLRRVEVSDLVKHLGGRRECQETVSEALGDKQSRAALRAQAQGERAATGWRTASDVEDDIVDFSHHHADDFPLRMLDLVVQSAQHTLIGDGMIILHKCIVASSRSGELVTAKTLEETAAVVRKHLGLDQIRA